MITTGTSSPAQPSELVGMMLYVAVIGAEVRLLMTSVICNVPAGSAATSTPAVPCGAPLLIVGASQLNTVPAGVFAGRRRIS